MLIAAAGTAVYLEFGTAIPKNGGEKNYLEFVYRRPKFLVTGLYTGYVVLLGWAASNSIVFGEYILHAAQVEVGRWNQRGVGCKWDYHFYFLTTVTNFYSPQWLASPQHS